jgi:hypothetical protein
MSTIVPQGEALKKAIEWVSEQRENNPGADPEKLADEAGFRFDLSPRDSQFLLRLIKDGKSQNPS